MKATSRRWWRILAAFCALTLVAAACGDDDDEAPAPSAGADSSTDISADADTAEDDADMAEEDMAEDDADMAEEEMAEEEMAEDDADMAEEEMAMEMISDECPIPNPDSEVEIDLMGWEFPIVSQYAEEVADCEAGNYSFNYQFLDSVEARNAMTLDASTGAPTFEVYQGSNAFIGELANQGFVLPLNDLVDKYRDEFNLDQIDQAFWDMASIDGNIYSIPMISNTMHIFYNEAELAELGVAVPTTFDEAFAACEQVIAGGYDIGFLYMLSAGWAWQIEFDSVLGSMGVTPIDPVTGQPNFNSPDGVAAATLLRDMWQRCAPDAAGSYSTDDVQAAFQTGEAILGHTWASRAGAMDDPEASTVVGEIQFAPALSTGGDTVAAPAYIDGWMIPVGTPDDMVEKIFLVMLAATDLESQEAAAEFGLVTRTGVSHPNGPRDAAAAEASLVRGRGADLTHPAAGLARAKLGEALVTILDGTPVEEALAAAEAAYLAEASEQGLL